jgi:hypothetical protein
MRTDEKTKRQGITEVKDETIDGFDHPGGDQTTRYNYLLDAYHNAADWYFENSPSSTSGNPDTSILNTQTAMEYRVTSIACGVLALARSGRVGVCDQWPVSEMTVALLGLTGWRPTARSPTMCTSMPIGRFCPCASAVFLAGAEAVVVSNGLPQL